MFEGNAVVVALHSMAHQIQLAVPLVVLSSTRDVNCTTVEQDDSGIVAYFFDTTVVVLTRDSYCWRGCRHSQYPANQVVQWAGQSFDGFHIS